MGLIMPTNRAQSLTEANINGACYTLLLYLKKSPVDKLIAEVLLT